MNQTQIDVMIKHYRGRFESASDPEKSVFDNNIKIIKKIEKFLKMQQIILTKRQQGAGSCPDSFYTKIEKVRENFFEFTNKNIDDFEDAQ